MKPTFELDHLLILVDELAQATENFEALGFATQEGSNSSLIPFADGSYLELMPIEAGPALTFRRMLRQLRLHNLGTRGRSRYKHRIFNRSLSGPALAELTLRTDNLDEAMRAAQQRGLEATWPVHTPARKRPGQPAERHKLAVPACPDTPLVAEVGTQAGAAPAPEHPNGAQGIAGVTMLVTDLDTSIERYQALLGADPIRPGTGAPIPNRTAADFPLAERTLTVAAPTDYNTPLYFHLKHYGERPYAIQLFTTSFSHASSRLNLRRTNDIQIWMVGVNEIEKRFAGDK